MKNKFLLAAFAILYQVSESKSWVNEQLENPQNLERTGYKETNDKYGEISIKREGGLKKIVSFSNESNEATNKKFNAKKQKLHELRRLRKSRSNETNENSNKDIIKLRKFTSDFGLKRTAKSGSNETKTNETVEETNSKMKSREDSRDSNSSHEYMFHSHLFGVQGDYSDFNKEINSSSGDQNLTTSYRDHRKQNQFRHLWGQDRSIHSYRSAPMHKKPFWYSIYHFPRSKVTVAGLNIPWFRVKSTVFDKGNIHREPIQLSKSDNTFEIKYNNTSQLSTTPASIKIRETNISDIAEYNITTVNITEMPSQAPIILDPRQPHWPNFYKNMDQQTSEKSFMVYKSVRVPSKPEGVETEKTTVHSNTEPGIATTMTQKTTKVHFNEIFVHTNSVQNLNKTIIANNSKISNLVGEVDVINVDHNRGTMKLQNVTPRISTTNLTPIREPQWPPWPQWLSEPLQTNKNVYNGSYVLNEYTVNVYANNEKSGTWNPLKLNNTTEKIKRIEESQRFFDIASTYKGLTANIAALLPLTTGITIVTTTEPNNYTDKMDENSHDSENRRSPLLPNLRNIVRCTQGCPLTPEFNPVCGTDDITYTNPGRLLCLQFCGLDVKVKKYQPCLSKHKLSEYPNMINLFINTAVESLRAAVRANASVPTATAKANHASTPSPTKSTTYIYYGRYDSFSINDEDEDGNEAKAVIETTTNMPSRHTPPTDTTIVVPMTVNKYLEKLKQLINFNTAYNKRFDSQSTTTNGPLSQVKEVTYSSKKIESNLAALNNMLKHSGRDISTKYAAHSVTLSSRDVATKRFSVTRAIKDVSTKKFKINFPTNARKSSSTKNNLILKPDTPHVDALDSVDEPNNNGRRFVESPFVDLPYSSGEYISHDDNTIDVFQEKDSEDPGDDADNKLWGYQPEKDKNEEIKVKEKMQG